MNTRPLILQETNNGYCSYGLEDEMLTNRKIFCTGVIDAESVNSLILQLMYLESQDAEKEITLYINSGGGEVLSGLALYDVMNTISCPIRTVCTGIAASMGSILFVAGDKREMLPHSKIMIHDPLAPNLSGDALKIQQLSDGLLETRMTLAGILSKHSGKSVDEILAKTVRDCYFTAEQAIEFGLADSVVKSSKSN